MEPTLAAIIAARNESAELLVTKRAERARLDSEIDGLDAEVAGFNRYIARHGGGVDVPTYAAESDVERWRKMNRTDVVVEALRIMDRPASPKEIAAQLRRMGRDDEPLDVGRALHRVKEQGRVISGGRGQWVTTDSEVDLPADEGDPDDSTDQPTRLHFPPNEPPSPNGTGHPAGQAVP